MTTKGYTVLGWLVWQVLKRVVQPKIAENKVKIGAAATVVRRARSRRTGRKGLLQRRLTAPSGELIRLPEFAGMPIRGVRIRA